MITQEDYDLIQQPNQDIYVKLYLLNYQFKIVGQIEGVTLPGGSITEDCTLDVRKTMSLSLVIKDSSFLVSDDKKIWLDKYVRVDIGVKNIRTQQIKYYKRGLFLINQPSITYSSSDKTLSFTGEDLMAKLTGKRGGYVQSDIKIDAGTPINDAVKTTVQQLGGFSKLIVDSNNRTIPEDITPKIGETTIYSIISKIRDYYMDYEIYFDEDGIFYYQAIKNKANDPILLDFSQLKRNTIILKPSIKYDFENVKNRIIVNGRQLDDGTKILYTLDNTNTNSKFNINSSIGIIPLPVNNEQIFTQEQAQLRAEYELFKHGNLCETINFEMTPVYWLRTNNKIRYINSDLEISGDYIVKKITIPLDVKTSMTIEAYKLYY